MDVDESTAAPDGSPVAVYLVLPARDEANLIHSALEPGASILELGCGAGRVTRCLTGLGHEVVAVDQSPEMLVHVRGTTKVIQANIETLALDRRFGGVVLASYLMNTVDRSQRARFLATCRRHVADDGNVVIQRIDPAVSWAPGVYEWTLDPVFIRLSIAKHAGTVIDARLDYRIGSRTFPHSFSAEVLDDVVLDADLAAADLRVDHWLNSQRTWLVARSLPRSC